MGHTVQLSGAEFAAWAERGRDAARYRVSVKRAARQATRDLGLDVCDVVGPDGDILERLYLHRCTGPNCPGLAYSAFDCAHPASCSEPAAAVCPRCLDIEPGRPGGTPDQPHSGPFTRDLCAPCERESGR